MQGNVVSSADMGTLSNSYGSLASMAEPPARQRGAIHSYSTSVENTKTVRQPDMAETKVTWASLPRKDQLVILFLVRFCEPIVKVSISSYVYFQLQSLSPSLPSATIVQQTTLLQAAYTIAQSLASVFLGSVADSSWGGRKAVIVLSLLGSFVACSLFGFVANFKQALVLRSIEGLTNGTVAMVRTMTFQARAFVLLNISTSLAIILSALVAAGTVELTPKAHGSELLTRYPYALPALLNASFLLVVLLTAVLFLEEACTAHATRTQQRLTMIQTSKLVRHRYDPGIALSRYVISWIQAFRQRTSSGAAYAPVDDMAEEMAFLEEPEPMEPPPKPKSVVYLPTTRILTKTLVLILLAAFIHEAHLATSSVAFPNLLVTPVSSKEEEGQRMLPLFFGGGVGFTPLPLAAYSVMYGAYNTTLPTLVSFLFWPFADQDKTRHVLHPPPAVPLPICIATPRVPASLADLLPRLPAPLLRIPLCSPCPLEHPSAVRQNRTCNMGRDNVHAGAHRAADQHRVPVADRADQRGVPTPVCTCQDAQHRVFLFHADAGGKHGAGGGVAGVRHIAQLDRVGVLVCVLPLNVFNEESAHSTTHSPRFQRFPFSLVSHYRQHIIPNHHTPTTAQPSYQYPEMARFTSKIILVSSCASGSGAAIVRRLASEGALVIAADRSGQEALATEMGASVIPWHLDVTSEDSIRDLEAYIRETHGRLDVLVNNTGIGGPRCPILDVKPADAEQVFRYNIHGAFLLLQLALRFMTTQPTGGSIVLTASIAGLIGTPNSAPYAISKGAVIAMTKTTAVEYCKHGIRVNAVAPGPTAVPMVEALGTATTTALRARIPQGRLAEPREVAGVVAFLADEEDAGHVTGQVCSLDKMVYEDQYASVPISNSDCGSDGEPEQYLLTQDGIQPLPPARRSRKQYVYAALAVLLQLVYTGVVLAAARSFYYKAVCPAVAAPDQFHAWPTRILQAGDAADRNQKAFRNRVPSAEIRRLGIEDESIWLDDDVGEYYGSVWVGHNLHCVKYLYNSLHMDHYYHNMTEAEEKSHNSHSHMSPLSLHWVVNEVAPVVNWDGARHTCANWDRVMDWAKKAKIVPTGKSSLGQVAPHPLYATLLDEHGHADFLNQDAIIEWDRLFARPDWQAWAKEHGIAEGTIPSKEMLRTKHEG
ncbi:hypothetical protein F66182_1074 [Fusarium sp. NRRL 66182]|nr:hypothetical protein F66182_1074 [Fusarium sp. NRRL 66182]